MEKRFDKKSSTRIIVITGAESTGKSTLSAQLSNYYKAPFIPEIAREYIEQLNRRYTYFDVEIIAKKQVQQLEKQLESNPPFIFLDTWLIVTKIWFEVVFQKEPDWLIEEIRKTKIDLFLVCDTDLPWIPDPVRENGGAMREILQAKYIDTISQFNFKHKIVSGKAMARFEQAVKQLNELQ